MFDPELNPYIAEIEKYRDIIVTDDFTGDEERRKQTEVPVGMPVIIDLGCGAGNFLRDYAQRFPGNAYFGFELRYKRLVKGAIKFKKRQIENVKLIQSRAESVHSWFNPKSVKAIHINFPDPWPKKRHHKHRLLNERFFSVMKHLLVDDGHWIFKTDHKAYFSEVAELAKRDEGLAIVSYSEDLHQSEFNDTNILTEFELLFKNKGYPVYYLKCALR